MDIYIYIKKTSEYTLITKSSTYFVKTKPRDSAIGFVRLSTIEVFECCETNVVEILWIFLWQCIDGSSVSWITFLVFLLLHAWIYKSWILRISCSDDRTYELNNNWTLCQISVQCAIWMCKFTLACKIQVNSISSNQLFPCMCNFWECNWWPQYTNAR